MPDFSQTTELFSRLSPAVAVHLSLALSALVLGPFALWARKGSPQHRSLGYAWVLVMLGTAVSSLFIRDFSLPNLAGYTPIHLLTLATFSGIGTGLWFVAKRRIGAHQRAMRGTYIGGCLVAGLFTLLPSRLLGQLLWQQALGWV